VIAAIVVLLAAICLLVSLIPLLPLGHGMVRSFDFGRLQVIGVSFFVILGVIIAGLNTQTLVVAAVLAACAICIQVFYVVRFTPLWRVQTARFEGNSETTPTISVLACNVKQGNRDYQRVIDLIEERQPDIAVFMETDQAWADALRPCLSKFRERIEQPQEDSYGMIFASHLPLREREVRFLLNEEVPSITCVVQLSGSRDIRMIAIHPEPPLPNRDTLGRDAEILVAAKIAREERLPVIVTGDLNDVAWSRTTRRFLRISGLLDPRQGRGMFNSFDARYWFLRWPLDHIFHSRDFELVSIERQKFVGSDHFPMFYRLALTAEDRNDPPPEPSGEDIKEADAAINVEANRNRRPAGTDWEDG
jgi:endonuclease/exonuclease/phosphatase (EEP) superfamily protein YafD